MANRSISKEDFLKKAIAAHGTAYDYRKTVISPQLKVVTVTCKAHGDFSQNRDAHCRGQGCPTCWKERQRSSGSRYSFEEWVEKANAVHGNKYRYVKSSYKGTQFNVDITCEQHGPFIQVACQHMLGYGCKKCASEKVGATLRSNTYDFIKKAKELHGDKYDYSSTAYVTAREEVEVICLPHGTFKVVASEHVNSSKKLGCPTCSKLSIKPRASIFKPTKKEMRSKRPCLEEEEWIRRARLTHGDRYDYSYVSYTKSRKKVTVNCSEHGPFKQEAASHIQGSGCPVCCRSVSSAEGLWLDSINVQKRQVRVGRYKVDGLSDDEKVVYEFLGDFWHGNPAVYKSEELNSVVKKTFKELHDKTLHKVSYLKSLGYEVVTKWESDWYKEMGFDNVPRLSKKTKLEALKQLAVKQGY